MASFAEVEQAMLAASLNPAQVLGNLRATSIKALSDYNGRNVIAYYSSFLNRPVQGSDINDMDVNGFMNVVNGMDRSRGLDLILHTPGGGITATEHIVHYLRDLFSDNIRCIVPQIAMSAGTMIACACKEIVMGRQSNLGPIDPQFRGVPCHGVVEEFERAIKQISQEPESIGVWRQIIQQYTPTFLGECQKAMELSKELVKRWLSEVMFAGQKTARRSSTQIVNKLSNHGDTKTHDRHIPAKEAQAIGLRIRMMEEDQKFQDLILTLHHCYMLTFNQTKFIKVIESSHNRRFIINGQ